MNYELTINGKTHIVSESVARKAAGGKEIPSEGLTVETKTKNIAEIDHVSKSGSATIRPA